MLEQHTTNRKLYLRLRNAKQRKARVSPSANAIIVTSIVVTATPAMKVSAKVPRNSPTVGWTYFSKIDVTLDMSSSSSESESLPRRRSFRSSLLSCLLSLLSSPLGIFSQNVPHLCPKRSNSMVWSFTIHCFTTKLTIPALYTVGISKIHNAWKKMAVKQCDYTCTTM